MSCSHKLDLEVPKYRVGDFKEYLNLHQKAGSFQIIGNHIHLTVVTEGNQEFSAFIDGVTDIFEVRNIKQQQLCNAKCRDGTKCLNHAHKNSFCWKHQ